MKIFQMGIISTLVIILGMGCSGSHSRHHLKKSSNWTNRVATQLALTQAQKERLEAVAKALITIESKMTTLRAKHRSQLIELLGQETLEQSQFDAMIHSAQLEFEDMSQNMVIALKEFHMTLNVDQKEKLTQLMHEQPKRRFWH